MSGKQAEKPLSFKALKIMESNDKVKTDMAENQIISLFRDRTSPVLHAVSPSNYTVPGLSVKLNGSHIMSALVITVDNSVVFLNDMVS